MEARLALTAADGARQYRAAEMEKARARMKEATGLDLAAAAVLEQYLENG